MVIPMTQVTNFNSDLHNRIAELLLAGKEPMEVCVLCECSNQEVYLVKNSARYQQLCYNGAMKELLSTGVRAAVDTLIEICKDKKANKTARVSASDKLLSYTGYYMSESGQLHKSPATMTQSELQERLAALHNEAIQRSKPAVIEGEAVQEDDDPFINLLK